MKKILTFTISSLLSIASIMATYNGTGTFKKITTLAELENGAYYILYGTSGENTGALSNDKKQNPDADSVNIVGNCIVNPSENIVWKLETNENNWRLYNESESFYCEVVENATKFTQNQSATHDYTVTVSDGNFTFTSNHAEADSRWIGIGTDTFKPYKSGNKTLNLYKLQNALTAPNNTAASNISETNFTANWESVTDATSYTLNIYEKKGGEGASDLIISQYYEGKGYDKAIELFNGTNSDIDLSDYSLKLQKDGAGEFGDELTLSGTLNTGCTYLIVCNYASTSEELKNKADLATNTLTKSFNGNDPIALFKNDNILDMVGVPNNSSNFAEDVTLIRKATVSAPNATYNANEWSSQDIDTDNTNTNNLGTHTMDAAGGFEEIADSPFVVGNETSFEVSGLTAGTTYKYTVIANSEEKASSMPSNETTVTTLVGFGASTCNNNTKNNVIFDGKYIDNAQNVKISIYNTSGMLLVRSTQNINLQNFDAGIYIVRTENSTFKIVK